MRDYARQPSRGRYVAVALLYALGAVVQEHAGDTAVCDAVAGLVAAGKNERKAECRIENQKQKAERGHLAVSLFGDW